jgi:hypothetical protein
MILLSLSPNLLRALVGAGICGALAIPSASAQSPLERVQTIPLPDVRGRIDHMGIDLDDETAAQVTTAPGARTGLFAPSRNALYVAVPARAASPAELRVYAVR